MLCKRNDIDMVNKIINYGIDMDTCDSDYNAPIHWACSYSDEISKILINIGVKIETKNIYGLTPLHYICINLPKIDKIFIDKCSDLNPKDNKGRRPIDFCTHNRIINELIKAGADP